VEIGIFRQEDADQVGMALEADTVEVEGLPLVPVGGREDGGDGRQHWFVPGHPGTDEHPAGCSTQAVVIVEHFHLAAVGPVDTGDGLEEEALPVEDAGRLDHLVGSAVHRKPGAGAGGVEYAHPERRRLGRSAVRCIPVRGRRWRGCSRKKRGQGRAGRFRQVHAQPSLSSRPERAASAVCR
jgi:hypothetical protein